LVKRENRELSSFESVAQRDKGGKSGNGDKTSDAQLLEETFAGFGPYPYPRVLRKRSN